MIKRIIHISHPSHISTSRSQLIIDQGGETHSVPIEDIAVVILDDPSITLTHPLLGVLAESGVMLISSDDHHTPIGLHLPLYTHSTPSLYYRDQIDCSLPTRKQIWQQLIRAKLRGQGAVLSYAGYDPSGLISLSERVRSGDPDNLEAQGARQYWQTLFGRDYDRRDPGHPANSRLNYGYSLIRSALARAVVGAGLLPMIGIWHDNRYNPYNLVDDLIEPLRPMVDQLVVTLLRESTVTVDLTSANKKSLCTLLTRDLFWGSKRYDLFVVLTYYVASFRGALTGTGEFQIPEIPDLTI